MEKLTIISLDSHAQTPPEAWATYLEKRFHSYLPALREENEIYTGVMRRFLSRNYDESKWPIFDLDGAYRAGGVKGLYDLDTRLAEMDREGIAAEFVYNGDPRICGLFFQSSNREYPMDVCQAGVKAYHRWLSDAFGPAKDRLFPIGIIGSAPWRSMDELLQELDWIADRGFAGTAIPGYSGYGELPLFDRFWDPFWARCQERGIALWVHAGHGERQGELGKAVHKFHQQVTEEGGSIDDLVKKLVKEIFNGQLFSSAKPRRAMWQLMMGGVFDRFPRLKVVMNEVYGDWIPATLHHLDKAFEERRGELSAKRKPSEYWRSNGIVCLSFIRKCEVALRREIGLDTVTFGRDYPHGEGTWPNTKIWLREAFAGVPAEEIRQVLTENPIRHFGLDRARLAAVAQRIGFPLQEITEPGPAARPELIDHFEARGHFLQAGEGETRISETDAMMKEDLWRVGAIA